MQWAVKRAAELGLVAGMMAVLALGPAWAAGTPERARIEAFLKTTGFDVALDSIRLSAGLAPQMLGFEAEDFGLAWTRRTEDVFDTEIMRGLALDMLEPNLTPVLLDHAAGFYASDLGMRLVEAENASHMIEDDAAKSADGEMIISGLVRLGSPRLQDLQRLTLAVDSAGSGVNAIMEIQVRFIMAAATAGVLDLQVDEQGLRAMIGSQEAELRRAIQRNALTGAAYTYQSFSDEEVAAYATALEDPVMQEVYTLMNAVQFEIMANRFEALAHQMAGLEPATDL